MPEFTAADGATIFYSDEGVGRPVIFLHGLMAHGGFFKRQSALASGLRLIALDLRGHGASRRKDDRPTMAQITRDVEALCETLDLRDAIGVGWSLGASILWSLLTGPASRRFAGGVSIDMTPCVQNGPDWHLGLGADHCAQRTAAMKSDYPAFAAAAGRAIFAEPEGRSRADADWAALEFQKNDPAAIGALWESLAAQDYRAALPAIAQPALIVHGARSHLYGRATADYLAAAIPHARRVQFDHSGHTPHMEQPDLLNQLLADFAASLPPVTEPHETAA